MRAEHEKKTLMRGVLVLMPAALFTKCIGLFYKIPLLFIVGVEGMAYFLAAYHIYSLLFVLSSTGLPTALSLQIARALATGRGRHVRRIFGVSLTLFLSVGLLGTALLMLGARPLAARLAMADAAAAILAIAPALLLAAFIGAAKGFFQGHGQMGTTALSEVLEAAGKLGFGLCFALWARKQGLSTPEIAAYAIFGITAGMALAALVLLVALCRMRLQQREQRTTTALPARRAVLSELCRVALPITLSASVMSLVSLLDTALISARLQSAGFAPEVANALYSSYGNLAIPLYNLVPSLLSPITLALMPLLGAATAGGDREAAKGALATSVRLTALIAIPAGLGLSVFARPLLSLIYAGQNAAIDVAAPLLSVLALSVLPASLLTVTGAALQATGHTTLPVVAMGAGAAVKLLLEGILLCVPDVNITGAPISTLACTVTVLLIEWIALSRVLSFPVIELRDLFRPLLVAVPAVVLGAALYLWCRTRFGEAIWQMPVVLVLTVLAVLLLALRARAVEREDLLALPAGERLCHLLEKCKLLK